MGSLNFREHLQQMPQVPPQRNGQLWGLTGVTERTDLTPHLSPNPRLGYPLVHLARWPLLRACLPHQDAPHALSLT